MSSHSSIEPEPDSRLEEVILMPQWANFYNIVQFPTGVLLL